MTSLPKVYPAGRPSNVAQQQESTSDDELEQLEAKLREQEARMERRREHHQGTGTVQKKEPTPPANASPKTVQPRTQPMTGTTYQPAPPAEPPTSQTNRPQNSGATSTEAPAQSAGNQQLPNDSPYDQKEADSHTYVPATKAFDDVDFMHSREARGIRVLSEFEGTRARLVQNRIEGFILVFGSARSMYADDLTREMESAGEISRTSTDASTRERAVKKLQRLERCRWMTKYCVLAEDLARRLTLWTMSATVRMGNSVKKWHSKESYLTEGLQPINSEDPDDYPQQFVVASGGGPGLMEAVNKGAASVPGSKTAGLAISVPFEKGLNRYVSPDLAMTFHYFFTRKFWMMYPAKAVIACPGGFGTFDELFECLTLKQTRKMDPKLPVVLLGREFWDKAVNFQFMADMGVISQDDYDDMLITDDIDEAFRFLVERLTGTPPPPLGVPIYSTILFSGPSGVGKGTIIKKLMEQNSGVFGFSVSHTTRAPRPGEKPGRDYHYVGTTDFLMMRERGEFVESCEVHGNWYGTTFAAVKRVHDEGHTCILDIDVQGAKKVHDSKMRCMKFFINPPSLAELEKRLRGRGTESEEKIQRRLKNAKDEIEFGNGPESVFDAVVVNDTLKEVVPLVNKLIFGK
eukprot:TRINITY_DN52335_c0_g1_i1.p1 TRINITY_DN52335_c0_g1~~TRINITY_DN52335_c0_g1_i1.p1  ORF type:complete len:632 (+),score=62.35 TRINITY_DN52335_c0_g1_i1:40-1935(+)